MLGMAIMGVSSWFSRFIMALLLLVLLVEVPFLSRGLK